MAKVVLTSLKSKNFSDEDLRETVGRAFSRLDFDFKSEIRNVAIKPNLCYYWDFSTGETTDPRVVGAIIDQVRSEIGDDVNISVVEADASAMKTKYSFDALGYSELMRKKEVDLVNLCQGEISDFAIKVRDKELTLPINSILLNADLVINVPKLKTHNVVGMTCAFKNMFGSIAKARKYSYHNVLPYAIVAVNKKVRSHITVVDGIVAKGRYPKKMGVIMASDDPLANDFTVARIMGFSPGRVEHLALAENEGLWQTKNIDVIEDNVKMSEIKAGFPSYNHFMHRLSWNLQIRMLRLYCRVAKDVVVPVLDD